MMLFKQYYSNLPPKWILCFTTIWNFITSYFTKLDSAKHVCSVLSKLILHGSKEFQYFTYLLHYNQSVFISSCFNTKLP